MDRDEALGLLRSQHAFPGPYRFRAVVRAGESAGVVTAVSAATEQVTDVEEAPSRKGTYVSLRVTARVRTAEEVLDVYEVLGRLEQVITTI